MGGATDTGAGFRIDIPKPKPVRRIGLWVILIALLVVVVAYLSIPTRMELVSTPPSEFLQARSEWNAKQREAEARLARAYWDCAFVTLQWKYPYGVSLPEKPPAEFQVDAGMLAGAMKLAPQSRERLLAETSEGVALAPIMARGSCLGC